MILNNLVKLPGKNIQVALLGTRDIEIEQSFSFISVSFLRRAKFFY